MTQAITFRWIDYTKSPVNEVIEVHLFGGVYGVMITAFQSLGVSVSLFQQFNLGSINSWCFVIFAFPDDTPLPVITSFTFYIYLYLMFIYIPFLIRKSPNIFLVWQEIAWKCSFYQLEYYANENLKTLNVQNELILKSIYWQYNCSLTATFCLIRKFESIKVNKQTKISTMRYTN